MKIFDCSDIKNPKFISQIINGGQVTNIYLNEKETLAFLAGGNEKGLSIIDISDKANPFIVSEFPTPNYAYTI